MHARVFTLAAAAASLVAVTAQDTPADAQCAKSTFGTICEPSPSGVCDPSCEAGAVYLLFATGLPGSKAISVKLRRHSTGVVTPLSFFQSFVQADGTSAVNPTPTEIVTSRHYLSEPSFPNAFVADYTLPCRLFPDGVQTSDTFDYLLTHYYGPGCAAGATAACQPLLVDVPPLSGPHSMNVSSNWEWCSQIEK